MDESTAHFQDEDAKARSRNFHSPGDVSQNDTLKDTVRERVAREARVEEPLFILKIELDGQNKETVKVFKRDSPRQIVRDFSAKFNLSDMASNALLAQIQKQKALKSSD